MRIWGITDTGLVRQENQDAYEVRTVGSYTVALVCDGMGGTTGGRLASALALDTFIKVMEQGLTEHMPVPRIQELIHQGVAQANGVIRQRAQEDPARQHMGTTLVAAIATHERLVVANVGDSRAYHIGPRGIWRITRDHSVVENMVQRGDITPEEARRHPQRNLITRALGPDPTVQADVFQMPWQQGEYILLCSDGLVNTVSDQEILFEVLHNGEADTCLDRLLALSKQRGAPDNVTAVLLMNL